MLTQQLKQGLAQMGLSYSEAVQQKLLDYLQLIHHWNQHFNLTAIRDKSQMVDKHLLDSLAVQPYVNGQTILDVGSGAGLPGIPFAITMPNKQMTLLDCNGKKTRFLTQAKIALKLTNVTVVQQRIEQYQPKEDGHRIYFDVIVARAYATNDTIIENTKHLQHDQTQILLMQGKLDKQIKSATHTINKIHKLTVAGLTAQRHLIEIQQKNK